MKDRTVALASLLVVILVLVLGSAPAALGGEALAADLDAIFSAPDLRDAALGCVAIDLATGETLYEREADRPLSLASNQKLFTTACALDRLGPAFRFETTLHAEGDVLPEGLLAGNLVVRGGGDPCIGTRFDGAPDGALARFARAVREAGIRRVGGDVVADDRLFDRERRHPGWPRDQLDRWYAAPVSALALNDGCVDVTVAPGPRPGAAPVVTLAPALPLFSVDLRASTTAERREHVVSVARAAGTERLTVRGAILAGADPVVTSVAVEEPALVFAAALLERLRAEGIEVAGAARLVHPDEPRPAAAPLVAHASLLAQALPVVNKRSQNFSAEMLFKTLAAHDGTGRPGSFEGGRAAVERFLAERLGAPEGSFSVEDGSGLARGNRAAPRQVARLLQAMARHRDAAAFFGSLAVPGAPGTLEKRLRSPALRGRVLAKTGSIAGVSALSGYVLVGAGGRAEGVAFSIVANGLRAGPGAARRAQDLAVEAIARALFEAGAGRASHAGAR